MTELTTLISNIKDSIHDEECKDHPDTKKLNGMNEYLKNLQHQQHMASIEVAH